MLGELTPEEIDDVLRSEAIGRIGCYAFGRPYVVPITYAFDGVAVYGHSREGLKLRMMRSHPTVCFEVDRFESASSWRSVIALGTFSELESNEAEIAMQLLRRRLAPLVPSADERPRRPAARLGPALVRLPHPARRAHRPLRAATRLTTAVPAVLLAPGASIRDRMRHP